MKTEWTNWEVSKTPFEPCEGRKGVFKENGNIRYIKVFSYVAILTEKGGGDVKAVRLDLFERKADAISAVRQEFPDWNVKSVLKLYDCDFEVDAWKRT